MRRSVFGLITTPKGKPARGIRRPWPLADPTASGQPQPSVDPRLPEAVAFLGLEPTGDPLTWRLPVGWGVCGATGTLHGGCGLAAVVAALESHTKRPLAAASAQYLSRIPQGGEAELRLAIGAHGNRMTQAAADLVDAATGQVVLRASVALGGRHLGIDRTWASAPDVPPPDDCARRPPTSQSGKSFNDYTDIRAVPTDSGSRTVCYWANVAGGLATTSVGLTALADLLPSGMRTSLGSGFRGSSLDNSVRIASAAPSAAEFQPKVTALEGWVLIEATSDAISNSIGSGVVRIFGAAGDLLATGSQSFAISQLVESLPPDVTGGAK